MSSVSAIFFDRDDTLIINVPYNGDPKKVSLMPNVPEALALLHHEGIPLFIASNQSGVGRGYITREDVAQVNQEMFRQLRQNYFTEVLNCYATDTADDPCRKPAPGMLQDAAVRHGLDLKKCFMVGDRLTDIQCGRNAGCKTVLVLGGSYVAESVEAKKIANHTASDLLAAAKWILENHEC